MQERYEITRQPMSTEKRNYPARHGEAKVEPKRVNTPEPRRSRPIVHVGSKVEGSYRGRGKWYPGKVTRDRGDGTFDVAYDDGESETRVEESLLRLIERDEHQGRLHVSPDRLFAASRSPPDSARVGFEEAKTRYPSMTELN